MAVGLQLPMAADTAATRSVAEVARRAEGRDQDRASGTRGPGARPTPVRREFPRSAGQARGPRAQRSGVRAERRYQSPEDHRVFETSEHVGGAPEHGQHAPHLRVGHLRTAHGHLDLQRRELDRVPVCDCSLLGESGSKVG